MGNKGENQVMIFTAHNDGPHHRKSTRPQEPTGRDNHTAEGPHTLHLCTPRVLPPGTGNYRGQRSRLRDSVGKQPAKSRVQKVSRTNPDPPHKDHRGAGRGGEELGREGERQAWKETRQSDVFLSGSVHRDATNRTNQNTHS